MGRLGLVAKQVGGSCCGFCLTPPPPIWGDRYLIVRWSINAWRGLGLVFDLHGRSLNTGRLKLRQANSDLTNRIQLHGIYVWP